MITIQNYLNGLEKFMHYQLWIVYEYLKKCILMNAFFKSQFSYCPFLRMCHSCANNRKINRLHEHCSQIIFSNRQSLFKTLLEKDGSVSVINWNLQIVANEMYKIKNDLPPFQQRNEQRYDSPNNTQFTIPPIRTVYHGWKVFHS